MPEAPQCRSCYLEALPPDERQRAAAAPIVSSVFLCPPHQLLFDEALAPLGGKLVMIDAPLPRPFTSVSSHTVIGRGGETAEPGLAHAVRRDRTTLQRCEDLAADWDRRADYLKVGAEHDALRGCARALTEALAGPARSGAVL